MSKVSGVYAVISVTIGVCLPTIAMTQGLSITVVDDSKHGVSSNIFQGGASWAIIGTTKEDGKLFIPSYKCSFDKPLLAEPINSSYFYSNQEPCKTPLSFLVHSRMIPDGTIAFNHIGRSVKFADGSEGEIDYRIAMNIAEYTATTHNPPLSSGGNGAQGSVLDSVTPPPFNFSSSSCILQYNIDGYEIVSQLATDGWRNVSQSQSPATKVFNFDKKALSQLFQNGVRAEANNKGIRVFIPADCSQVTAQTTNWFAYWIEEAIDQKVKTGEYKDLTQLNEPK